MVSSINCGFALWQDGMTFSGLLGRQYDGGASVIDSGASALAASPQPGVYASLAANLKVTAPVSGLSVTVAPGYCMVPAAAGQGGYRFGLMSSGSLTVAGNASGNPRIDLVVAQAHDLGSSSSFADINIITGTPAASPSVPATPATAIALAKVAVANGASSIVTGNITDLRPFTCSPGGILHLPSAAAMPAAPASQFAWNAATGQLVQGTGVAGSVTAYSQAGSGGTGFAYGLSGFPSLNFSADGMTDFEIYYEREPGVSGFSEIVTLQLFIDSARVDTCYTQDTSTVLGRVSATYYTSSRQGTTPSAGNHTVRLGGTATTASHTLRISPVVV